MSEWLVVNLSKFHQFHYVDAAVPAFASSDKIMRSAHQRRYLTLSQPGLLAGRNQAFEKRVVGVLKLRGPGLS